MSSRPEDIKIPQKRNMENEEHERATDNSMENIMGEEIEGSRLVEYEKRLERLKEEIKTLKKLKKRQEKINKLEEERMDVIREIEREKNGGRKPRRHGRH